MPRFAFSFSPLYRVLAAPFGVLPRTTGVEVDDDTFTVRFGPWLLRTPLDNVVGCERSGPYELPKTAGPAHLSLADHGMTCATNAEAGLCVRFAEPVAALDPLGRIRSPAITVTVERIDELAGLLNGESEPERDGDPAVMESPGRALKRVLSWPAGMATAAARYPGVAVSVARQGRRVGDIATTWPMHDGDRVQHLGDGVGKIFVRRYRARIDGSGVGPEQLIDRFADNLDTASPTEVAEFVEQTTGSSGELSPGQEFEIRMPGPWNGPVRVIDRTPTSIRLATLEGHMEAGEIEFSARRPDGPETGAIEFQIESVARSGDRLFQVVYDWLRIAREMQLFMWVSVCRNVAELIGGQIGGKISVETIQLDELEPAE